jgi:hypothetical protein
MKTNLLTGILCLTMLTVTAAAHAGEGRGKLREARRSGALTKEESKLLREEHKDIRKLREEAKADGKVSEEERAKLKEKRLALRKHAEELATNDVKGEPRKKRGRKEEVPQGADQAK